MIADQNPRRQDDKLWITFLGVETPVFPGPERIAALMNYPVLFVGMEKAGSRPLSLFNHTIGGAALCRAC